MEDLFTSNITEDQLDIIKETVKIFKDEIIKRAPQISLNVKKLIDEKKGITQAETN